MDITGNIKRFFKQEFFKNAIVHWLIIGAIILIVIDWGALIFFIRPVDFPVVLHYNAYFGVDIIGSWWQAYLMPAVALVIFAINNLLAYVFFRQGERIVSYLFLLASFIVQASVSIAVFSIIRINY